jgi:hydroxypyruvate isomerase
LFTEVELTDRFKAAKQAGFDAVEIQFPYTLPAQAIAELLQENGLRLVLFNVDAGDLLQGGEGLASVPEHRERFKAALSQTLSYAAALKPHAINILPGRCLHPERRAVYLETLKANLLLAADAFVELGVKVVFEAINTYDMPDFLIHSHGQMLGLLQELAHLNLFLQYDVYHMCRMGEDYTAFIQNHADRIGHIQFADVPGRGQPGTGNINFDGLFQTIERSGYTGWCGAEYKPSGQTLESLAWLKGD